MSAILKLNENKRHSHEGVCDWPSVSHIHPACSIHPAWWPARRGGGVRKGGYTTFIILNLVHQPPVALWGSHAFYTTRILSMLRVADITFVSCLIQRRVGGDNVIKKNTFHRSGTYIITVLTVSIVIVIMGEIVPGNKGHMNFVAWHCWDMYIVCMSLT